MKTYEEVEEEEEKKENLWYGVATAALFLGFAIIIYFEMGGKILW